MINSNFVNWPFEAISQKFNNLNKDLADSEATLREDEEKVAKLKEDIPELKQDIETLRIEMLKRLQKPPAEVLPKRRINV